MPRARISAARTIRIETQGRRAADALRVPAGELAAALALILQEGPNITITHDAGAGTITIGTTGWTGEIELLTETIVVENGVIVDVT